MPSWREQLQKTESESTADVRTDYNKWSRNVMLLRIDAYRKYEPLRMLNLLTILGVRLLARVPTVLTVLELVFERTLDPVKALVKRPNWNTQAKLIQIAKLFDTTATT